MARIVLCPGRLISKNDGDVHHVSAGQLAALYGVPFSRCVVWTANSPWSPRPEDVVLYPQQSGKYELPEKAKKIFEQNEN